MAASIDSDQAYDELLLQRAREAAERWDARSQVRDARTAAVEAGKPLQADSPARLALRVNYLIDDIRRTSQGERPPSSPLLKQLIASPDPVAPEDLDDHLVNEVVMGARDFLSIEFLQRGLASARSVGRVVVRAGSGVRELATGFLIGPGLMLTNKHVLDTADTAAACGIEMDYEHSAYGPAKTPQVFWFEPERFFVADDKLDYALVAVAPRSVRDAPLSRYGWLPLHQTQGKIAINGKDYLNIIQHPLGRPKEVVLRENRVLDLRTGDEKDANDTMGPFIHYEADTEKGSSGSPVLNDQWDVVALHHSGVPARDANRNWLNKDGGIWHQGDPVASIQWVANEGIRVSSLIGALSGLKVSGDTLALLKETLAAKEPDPPQSEPPRPENIQPPPQPKPALKPTTKLSPNESIDVVIDPGRSAGSRMVSVDIPIRVTVSIGDVAAAVSPKGDQVTPTAAESLSPSDLLVERIYPADYADRDGYDRKFLGVEVPLPTIKRRPRFGRLLRVPRKARPDDTYELRYHHFSVLMNADRRLAYVSACNVDFDAAAQASRKEGGGSWRLDPRLDDDQQLDNEYYKGKDNLYDRGHLTRRDDAAWGADDVAAIAANKDSFHYTNSAPQHYLLNQSNEFTGANLDLWGDLENYITEQGNAQRTRLSVFNGPVFGTNDKPLKDALVPLAFFKIVIWRDGNADPGAIGFVLDQADLVRDLAVEAINPGRFEIRQRRIADIEKSLDISFGPVSGWDVLRETVTEEAFSDRGITIRRTADIRLPS